MQQYFSNLNFNENDDIALDKDSLYHLTKVLRKDSKYTFRVVNNNHEIFLCHLNEDKTVHVDSKLDENNELDVDITCIISLIKNDKFELIIQKLVELGVKRIVPYNAVRSVTRIKDDKKLERLRKIVLEACEQSHRNIIPEVTNAINLKQIKEYKSKYNYVCYESENSFNNEIKFDDSLTYIIGPEGGFDENEYKQIVEMGFKSVSLGKRILRAETAAIYMTSVIVSKCQ